MIKAGIESANGSIHLGIRLGLPVLWSARWRAGISDRQFSFWCIGSVGAGSAVGVAASCGDVDSLAMGVAPFGAGFIRPVAKWKEISGILIEDSLVERAMNR